MTEDSPSKTATDPLNKEAFAYFIIMTAFFQCVAYRSVNLLLF